jgi:hypothetical protein
MRSHAWIAGLPALALLWGCEPTQLYVGATTVLGINAAMNTEQTAGHLKIGYDRTFVTVVPKSVPLQGEPGREAMAVLSCSEVEVTGIWLTGFREYLATGKAAMNYAELFNPNPAPKTEAGAANKPAPAAGADGVAGAAGNAVAAAVPPPTAAAPAAPAAAGGAAGAAGGAAADAAKKVAAGAPKVFAPAGKADPADDRIFNCVDNPPISK